MKLTLPYVYLTRHKISHSQFLGAMCTTGSYTFRKSHTQSLVSVVTLCKNFKTELYFMLNHSQTCIICQLWGKLNDLLQHSLTSKYSFEQPLRVNKERERVIKKSILFEYRKQKETMKVFFILKLKRKSDQKKTWVVTSHHCRISPVIPLMSFCISYFYNGFGCYVKQ